MKFEISLSSLADLQKVVSDFIKSNSIDCSLEPKVAVCCDEVLSNIIKYSGATFGELKLKSDDNKSLSIEIIDNGISFNPLEDSKTPDLTASAEERIIGGLGIHIVKKMAKSISYQRKNDLNVLMFTVSL